MFGGEEGEQGADGVGGCEEVEGEEVVFVVCAACGGCGLCGCLLGGDEQGDGEFLAFGELGLGGFEVPAVPVV